MQPANVATPETVVTGFVAQESVAPPGDWSARVTVAVAAVTVLPAASCTATTGWGPMAFWLVPLPGWVVKPSLTGLATETFALLALTAVQPLRTAVTA